MKIKKNHKRRRYAKPRLEQVRIDNQITMVMMTDVPPGDPGNLGDTSITPERFLNNPFKFND